MPALAWAQRVSPTQKALVMDAMGEIRDSYSPDLLGEIIDSGTNSVTVTLCDPKSQELQAYQAAIDGILHYDRFIARHPDLLLKATQAADALEAKSSGRLAIYYLTQNSTHIGRDLDRLDVFYSLGQRVLQLTYNHQNWVGAGCKERTAAGLTEFGLQMVEKLNSIGMLIDLSHASQATMADAIAASRHPVHISHTGCMAVHQNVRNTSDESIRAVAQKGGLVGICQIRPFLTSSREDNLNAYFLHLKHAISVAGVEHVSIGSDRDHRVIELSEEYMAELKAEEGPNFNPADWPLFIDELNGPRRMEVVWDGLTQLGLSEDDAEKVMGTNLLRLYQAVIG
jgi:membrane dipeptidase